LAYRFFWIDEDFFQIDEDISVLKSHRRDEPIWAITQVEMSQGMPCVAVLNKNVIFFLLQNWRTGRQNRSCQGVGTSGKGEGVGKGCGENEYCGNTCTHVCKWKNVTS
jgi:hypothetical protein